MAAQMWPDLGGLALAAEILQVGSPLGRQGLACQISRAWRAGLRGDIERPKDREYPMKVLCLAAMIALLTGPAAYAQTPNINLMPEVVSKTPEQKEADEVKDKAYRESLKKIPDAKTSSDPWGGVRSADTPKNVTTKAPAAKPKTKTVNGNSN
jgi:hypothetical protein